MGEGPAGPAAAGAASASSASPSTPASSSSSSSPPPPSPPASPPLTPKDYTHYIYAPVYTGLAGLGLGAAVGSLRGHSPLLYALHMGIGYGVFGATFSSTLYGLEKVRSTEDTLNWIGAGASAGAVTSAITGGRKKVVGGAVFFACLSVVAEAVFDLVGTSIGNYKHKRALERIQSPQEAVHAVRPPGPSVRKE